MTFAQYWQETVSRGQQDSAAARVLAEEAWDAALCAVQAQITRPAGKLADALETAAAVSALHTWNAPKPSNSPKTA
jgi:hypothetical protein